MFALTAGNVIAKRKGWFTLRHWRVVPSLHRDTHRAAYTVRRQTRVGNGALACRIHRLTTEIIAFYVSDVTL